MTRALAGVCLGVALVSACTESDPGTQPTTAVSPSSSVPPSPSATGPTPPEMPDLAKQDSKAGAQAFAVHYIELLNYGAATGETDELQGASRDCSGCNDYIDLYKRTYAAGGYFRDTGMKARTFFVKPDGRGYAVLMTVDLPRTRFKLDAEDDVQVGRPQEVSLTLTVARIDGRNVAIELTGITT